MVYRTGGIYLKVNYNFCGEIKVQLTGKEYSRLNTMKLKNRRRRIIQIFIEAISKSCMAYNNKKYNVSSYKAGKKKYLIFRPQKTLSLEFAVRINDKNLLSLIEQLYLRKCHEISLSSLYLYKGNYYLVITPLISLTIIEIICNEYLSENFYGEKVIKIKKEGAPVCSYNAIESLGSTLYN